MGDLRSATTEGLSIFCQFAELMSDHQLCEADWCPCPCHSEDERVAKEMREILTPRVRP